MSIEVDKGKIRQCLEGKVEGSFRTVVSSIRQDGQENYSLFWVTIGNMPDDDVWEKLGGEYQTSDEAMAEVTAVKSQLENGDQQ